MRVDDPWIAVGHPLSDHLGHTWALFDPDRRSRPKVVHLDGFTKAWHGIWREREQAVDGVLDLGIAEKVH